MNKSLPLQNNKIFSSYGGVGSMIDTIDDLSIIIEPFDRWIPLYDQICAGRHKELELNEPRLRAMVKSIGFDRLDGFFRLDTSLDDEYLVMDINAEYFMIYNASDEIQVEGKCGLDQENFAYIKNERGGIIGHAVYSNKQYYLLLNEEKAVQLYKMSEDPIIPEISNRES